MARALVLHDDGENWIRWSLAAAAVVTAHAGAIASYLLLVAPEAPRGANGPAVIMDLAPMPAAPQSQADLAPGPEMVEAQPVPEPTQPVETEPVAEPMPKLEVPAEVVLPTPEPKTEAKPEDKPVETPREKPIERVERKPPAPQTTAVPRSVRRNAPVARAPHPGSTPDRVSVANWRAEVFAKLQRAKRYPGGPDARREQGTVLITFTVDRHGQVLSRGIVRSSGNSELDQEALAMVIRAGPFPPVPPSIPGPTVQLPMPIRFSVR
jgi:protein TonB